MIVIVVVNISRAFLLMYLTCMGLTPRAVRAAQGASFVLGHSTDAGGLQARGQGPRAKGSRKIVSKRVGTHCGRAIIDVQRMVPFAHRICTAAER